MAKESSLENSTLNTKCYKHRFFVIHLVYCKLINTTLTKAEAMEISLKDYFVSDSYYIRNLFYE